MCFVLSLQQQGRGRPGLELDNYYYTERKLAVLFHLRFTRLVQLVIWILSQRISSCATQLAFASSQSPRIRNCYVKVEESLLTLALLARGYEQRMRRILRSRFSCLRSPVIYYYRRLATKNGSHRIPDQCARIYLKTLGLPFQTDVHEGLRQAWICRGRKGETTRRKKRKFTSRMLHKWWSLTLSQPSLLEP